MQLDLLPALTASSLYGGMAWTTPRFQLHSHPDASLPDRKRRRCDESWCITSPATELLTASTEHSKSQYPEESTDYTEATVEMMRDTNNKFTFENVNLTPLSTNRDLSSITPKLFSVSGSIPAVCCPCAHGL